MTLSIRAVSPQDYPAAAQIMTASDPDWPATAEQLALWASQRDPELFYQELAAERSGRVVAVAAFGHDDFAFEPDKYWLNLRVDPPERCQGVGSALYGHILGLLEARGAKKLQVMFSEAQQGAQRFVQARGFAEVWRRHESRLQTRDFDFAPFAELEAGIAARGLELRSVADLAQDPRLAGRLYELDWRLMQDVPIGEALTKRPFETWRKQELDDPEFSREASFVALDPQRDDPLSGPYVAYSSLLRNPVGFWSIGMTGVLPEYRGLGLAKALKLRGIRAIQGQGGGEIRTFNDPPNAAMLGMNRALGFVRWPDRLRYLKALP